MLVCKMQAHRHARHCEGCCFAFACDVLIDTSEAVIAGSTLADLPAPNGLFALVIIRRRRNPP